jgi:dihydrolipoamide dehydrogenase
MAETHYDLIVIGAGPGGYVAAIRAAQLGLKVACVDENAALGGTCLRVGCIPSKALLESSEQFAHTQNNLASHGIEVGEPRIDVSKMLKRKDRVVQTLTKGVASLFKKNGITAYQGRGKITEPGKVSVSGKDGDATLSADRILIATGSSSATLPNVDLAQDRIDTSTDALSYKEVPEHLAVIGAGYIGIELGSVWRRLGAKVTVLEYLDRVLPGMDSDLGSEAHKLFKKQGIEFKLGARVTGATVNKQSVSVELAEGGPVKADRVLVAVGRKPNTEGLGLEDVGVKVNDRGQIPVDKHFKTSVDGIYAIGDVIPGPMLAHKAEDEGVAFAEGIVTGVGHVNYEAVPAIVYTHPEIASVGQTEDALKDEGIEYAKGEFPFIANGRAKALDDTTGKVKILADATTDRVLGVHIIGPRAGDLIAECAMAMEFGASSEDIARTCHAHPTLSESVKEAALDTLGRAIHM